MNQPKVYAGINPRATRHVKRFAETERKIVENLAKHFYVTAGRHDLTIGQSDYRYFFLKFTDSFTETFGTADELIVLFSPFSRFEPRTLDAIERVQATHPGYRLDKISAFVISLDDDFVEKVDGLIKSEKETRIITPFTYSELAANCDEHFFRERIKKYYFERNLFDFDSPLRKDLYFFGREDVCQKLIDKHRAGRNGSLFGLRRSGKTSILLSIRRRLVSERQHAVLVDCQILHLLRWWDALFYLVKRVCEESGTAMPTDSSSYTEAKAAIAFESDMTAISRTLGSRVLLLLDEIEQITFGVSFSEHWNSGADYVCFWHVLRSMLQRQESPFTVILAGTNPRCLETPFIQSRDNPLYGQVTPEYISGFSLHQTRQMIETLSRYMGITIEDDVYTYLCREFGGHPFLIRQACSYMKSELDKVGSRTIDRAFYDRSVREFNEGSGQTFCEMVVGVLREYYKDEYTMLTYLSRGDSVEFNQLASSDPTYTQHLLGYGVLKRSSTGYDFGIDAVMKYLASKERYRRLNLSNPEKLAEIGERRNAVEILLRKLVSQVLRSIHGEDTAKQQVLAKHDPKKRARYASLAYRDLFDSSQHEIYFDDLRELMRRNWDPVFRNVFSEDVEKFSSRMILLNSIGRSDAHAKEVSEADMQTFRGTMQWLESKVSDYFQ